MQKINQPESAGKALDLQVEPLTAEEIQQVSGGRGPGKFLISLKGMTSPGASTGPGTERQPYFK